MSPWPIIFVTDWVVFNGGPARSLIYRTYSLTQRNGRITRALIMVHGAGRNADNLHNARCMFTAETALPLLFPKL
ncbi:MAG: hypothetical protein HY048_10550 [Acidobacteria bacterium]|nr:hypothetical protein [Acidobacteriota bacterium]